MVHLRGKPRLKERLTKSRLIKHFMNTLRTVEYTLIWHITCTHPADADVRTFWGCVFLIPHKLNLVVHVVGNGDNRVLSHRFTIEKRSSPFILRHSDNSFQLAWISL